MVVKTNYSHLILMVKPFSYYPKYLQQYHIHILKKPTNSDKLILDFRPRTGDACTLQSEEEQYIANYRQRQNLHAGQSKNDPMFVLPTGVSLAYSDMLNPAVWFEKRLLQNENGISTRKKTASIEVVS